MDAGTLGGPWHGFTFKLKASAAGPSKNGTGHSPKRKAEAGAETVRAPILALGARRQRVMTAAPPPRASDQNTGDATGPDVTLTLPVPAGAKMKASAKAARSRTADLALMGLPAGAERWCAFSQAEPGHCFTARPKPARRSRDHLQRPGQASRPSCWRSWTG
jgi:hypothetical protein